MNAKSIYSILFLYLLSFGSSYHSAISAEVDKTKVLSQLNHLEWQVDELIKMHQYEGDYAKQLQIEQNTTKFLDKVSKIENKEDQKNVYKYTLQELQKKLIFNIEKHNFYLKGFTSTIGYGTEVSYYYKNFLGFGFIFNYQDALFSEIVNKTLSFFSVTTGNIEYESDYYDAQNDLKPNSKTINFALYFSVRPFKNPIHLDVGLMFTKLTANGYVLPQHSYDEKIDYNSHSMELVYNNYSPKPYFNIGIDFEVYDFTVGFDFGIAMLHNKEVNDLFAQLEQFGISKGYLPGSETETRKEEPANWLGTTYKTYEWITGVDEYGLNNTARTDIVIIPPSKWNFYFKISIGYKFKI